MTARSGFEYVESAGVLEFEPGEVEKEIIVPILHNPEWHSTTEFKVHLFDATGCILVQPEARVKIIDCDAFPTRRYRDELMQPGRNGQLPDNIGHNDGQVSHWRLLFEYFKLNFGNKVVRVATIKCILADQLKNLLVVASMYATMVMIDVVLAPKGTPLSQHARMGILYVLAVVNLLPTALGHILDLQRCHWKLGGASRKLLQSNLMRKFLAYDAQSHSVVPDSLFLMTSTKQAHMLVEQGYVQIFPILKSLGELVVLCIFVGSIGFVSLAPMVVLPPSLAMFVWIRRHKTLESLESRFKTERILVNDIDDTASNYRLLADFKKRGDVVSKFETTIADYNKAMTATSAVTCNNTYFAPWLADLLVMVFTIFGGAYLINRHESLSFILPHPELGKFLTALKIFSKTGKIFAAMYVSVVKMMSAFPCLENVSTLMNLQVEDKDLLDMTGHRVEHGSKQRGLTHMNGEAHFKAMKISQDVDKIPIRLEGVTYVIQGRSLLLNGSTSTLNFSIWQGSYVGLTGPQRVGKNTVIYLLCGILHPSQGTVFVPPHITILHVPAHAIFLDRWTLYENLIVGFPGTRDEDLRGRVLRVLRRLGVDDGLIAKVDEGSGRASKVDLATESSSSCASWSDLLTYQQQRLLHTARALITNPELMVMHTPLAPFSKLVAKNIDRILREHVDLRGFEVNNEHSEDRHPRTCVASMPLGGSVDDVSLGLLDGALLMSEDGDVRWVHHDQAQLPPLGVLRDQVPDEKNYRPADWV
jgi:ABC-type multidrug transport system fused ATPase/permease subunit